MATVIRCDSGVDNLLTAIWEQAYKDLVDIFFKRIAKKILKVDKHQEDPQKIIDELHHGRFPLASTEVVVRQAKRKAQEIAYDRVAERREGRRVVIEKWGKICDLIRINYFNDDCQLQIGEACRYYRENTLQMTLEEAADRMNMPKERLKMFEDGEEFNYMFLLWYALRGLPVNKIIGVGERGSNGSWVGKINPGTYQNSRKNMPNLVEYDAGVSFAMMKAIDALDTAKTLEEARKKLHVVADEVSAEMDKRKVEKAEKAVKAAMEKKVKKK